MPRADLGALLGKVEGATPPAPPAVHEPESVDALIGVLEPKAKPATARSKAPTVAPTVDGGPTYLRFVRKETRLRGDQQNQLTLHARRLNRAKAPGVPRITDNTLIRVAVDLLLARIDHAAGDDEGSLLESLNQ